VKQRIIDSKQDCPPEEPEEKIVDFFNKLKEDIGTSFNQHFG